MFLVYRNIFHNDSASFILTLIIYFYCLRDDTINSNTTVRMSSARTLLGRKPAPVMASFSSRGPNKIQPSILKVHTI